MGLFYGPDIVRDPKGDFRVVEDNHGYLGGFADLKIGLDSLYKNIPEYRQNGEALHEHEPLEFYRRLIERFRSRSTVPSGKIVLVGYPAQDDKSHRQLADVFKQFGVESVTPFTLTRLEFDHDGAWFREMLGAPRERVGFLIVHGEYQQLDPQNSVTRHERLVGHLRNHFPDAYRELVAGQDAVLKLPSLKSVETYLMNQGQTEILRKNKFDAVFEGMIDSVLSGKVASNVTPGTEFLNDKEFYMYVEKIIEFYLHENPILPNIKTFDPRVRLANGEFGGLNQKLFNKVEREQENFVIKLVNGRGGRGVYVGAKISKQDFASALELVRTNPARYRFQVYTPFSTVGRQIADIRLYADVPPRGAPFVSDTSWGRVTSMDGDGRVNRAQGGGDSVVVTRSAIKYCSSLFGPTPSSAIFHLSH